MIILGLGFLKKIFSPVAKGAKATATATAKGTSKVVRHPAFDMAINVSTLFLPQAKAIKFLLVLRKVRELEAALGSGTGPQKFLAVWEALRDEPWITNDKELKELIELAVMVVHRRLQVRNNAGAVIA